MAGADLLIGLFLSKLFEPSPAARPAVVLPPPGAPPPTPPPSSVPSSSPGVQVSPPAFPSNVVVPASAPATPTPAPGMKRAVEVWQIKPDVVSRGTGVLAGLGAEVGAQVGPIALATLEQNFPQGWQPAKRVTAAEAAQAKKLLAEWRDGGVVFMGSGLAGRRAYRMTKHPATTATSSPAPVATPQAQTRSPGIVPASFNPSPTPAPAAPVITVPAVSTPAAAPVPTSTRQIVTVRRGEGLAQIAKRLGKPENAASAGELRAANVPQGPDAAWKSIGLDKGGVQKVGRPGGLQPGDHLFVPMPWGPIDPARL